MPFRLRRRQGQDDAADDGENIRERADFTIITSDNPRSEEPEAIIRDIEEGIRDTGGAYITIVNRKEG